LSDASRSIDLFQKKAMERLASLKHRDDRKPFAFLCSDLGEGAKYGIVSNEHYRLMRRLLPFIWEQRAQLGTGFLASVLLMVGQLWYASHQLKKQNIADAGDHAAALA